MGEVILNKDKYRPVFKHH